MCLTLDVVFRVKQKTKFPFRQPEEEAADPNPAVL